MQMRAFGRMLLISGLFSVVGSTGSCASPVAPVRDVPLTIVAFVDSQRDVFPREATLVIKDQAAWQLLWTRMTSNQFPPPDLPAVDFATDMLVVAATGFKPSSGYLITIVKATAQDAAVDVLVLETFPGIGCNTTPAVTSPVVVAALPRQAGDVTFTIARQAVNCGP